MYFIIDIRNFYYFSDSINYFKLLYWFIDYYNIIVIGKDKRKQIYIFIINCIKNIDKSIYYYDIFYYFI